MRGLDVSQERMFTVKTLNDFVPGEHPLRPIREIVNAALKEMDGLFAAMYSEYGRAKPALDCVSVLDAQALRQRIQSAEQTGSAFQPRFLCTQRRRGRRASPPDLCDRIKGRNRPQ